MKRVLVNSTILILIAGLVLFLSGCSQENAPEQSAQSSEGRRNPQNVSREGSGGTGYWPGENWRVSTPGEQGMDSGMLADMLRYIQNGQHNIHNIILIRNGYMVMDANFYPYKNNLKHVVNSCTKSVTSTLVGIAEGEGWIESTDEKVLDFFSGIDIQNVDERKKELSLKHLLTMTAGFQWSENGSYGPDDSWVQMNGSEDPIKYILNLPVLENPGTGFYYNTGAPHLLSAILQKATNMKTCDYARKKLFEPIGIKDVFWAEDPEGISTGGAGIFMTPLDMARFGYLYLRNGCWNGEQIVPENWVREATQKQVETPTGLAGRYGYGYQWWMNSCGGYSARGFGGQYIFVVPQYDIVAVFTSSLPAGWFFLPENLMGSFIIPAVENFDPDKEENEGLSKLQNIVKSIRQQPESKAVAPLPEKARRISGKTIECETGDRIFLKFNTGDNPVSAEFRHGPSNNILVGLDDRYHVSNAGVYWPLPDNNSVAAKGGWSGDNRFTIKLISLHEMDELTYNFTFDGDNVDVEFLSMYGGELMHTKGKIK